MSLDSLLRKSPAWLGRDAGGIIISSRVRLARNLADKPFPGWAAAETRSELWRRVAPVLAADSRLEDGLCAEMPGLQSLQRQLLFERHLISREFINSGEGSGLAVSADQIAAVMVNEEDHLRIQVMYPGLALEQAWQTADEMDNRIDRCVDYAFSPRLGYLTACPTNLGTGLRASVMLHLPGLVFMGEMLQVLKGLSKIDLAVRGLWGEGTETLGNLFQVSNQVTLGSGETDIVANLRGRAEELVEHEKHARQRLLEQRENLLLDRVGRARGILTHARRIDSKEALTLLSHLRLGVEMGILKQFRRSLIDELWVASQPAHLQWQAGGELQAEQRDRVRADLMREMMKKAEQEDNGNE